MWTWISSTKIPFHRRPIVRVTHRSQKSFKTKKIFFLFCWIWHLYWAALTLRWPWPFSNLQWNISMQKGGKYYVSFFSHLTLTYLDLDIVKIQMNAQKWSYSFKWFNSYSPLRANRYTRRQTRLKTELCLLGTQDTRWIHTRTKRWLKVMAPEAI